jgi:hypothetical protein
VSSDEQAGSSFSSTVAPPGLPAPDDFIPLTATVVQEIAEALSPIEAGIVTNERSTSLTSFINFGGTSLGAGLANPGAIQREKIAALDGVTWGVWDVSYSSTKVEGGFNDEVFQTEIQEGFYLLASGISPTPPRLPGTAVGRFSLSFGGQEGVPVNSPEQSILMARTGTAGPLLGTVSLFNFGFDLDLESGRINNGGVEVRYQVTGLEAGDNQPPSETIAWNGHFSGVLASGSARPDLRIDWLGFCSQGFCLGSDNPTHLSKSKIDGIFSGENGQIFWGGLVLQGFIPAGGGVSENFRNQGMEPNSANIYEALQLLVRVPCSSSECSP